MRGLLDARNRFLGDHSDGVRHRLRGGGEDDSSDYGSVADVYTVSDIYTAAYAHTATNANGSTDVHTYSDSDTYYWNNTNPHADADSDAQSPEGSNDACVYSYLHSDRYAHAHSDTYAYSD